jgi:hypothetical protein
MCDPVGMIGLALSVGMQAANASAQQDMINKQNQANNQWLAYQRQKARQENIRQEMMRQRAETALKGSEEKLNPLEQEKARQGEEQRLTTEFTPKDMFDQHPELIGDKLLSGQTGGADIVQSDLAGRLKNAATEARARIANLAAIQSYGGSSFSLANRANDILGTSLQDIRLQGNLRQGSLTAYQAEKSVEPIRYERGSSSAGGIAQGAAGLAGKALGGALAGGA